MVKGFIFLSVFFLSYICLCFSGNVQSQQVWGVSWHEACAAGLQRCTGELLICLLVFWISKLTAKYVSCLHWGVGYRLVVQQRKEREGESNHGGVWRPVALRCLSAMAAEPAQQSGTVAREAETQTNPSALHKLAETETRSTVKRGSIGWHTATCVGKCNIMFTYSHKWFHIISW